MKKKNVIILTSILVVLLIIGLGVYRYFFTPDPQVEAQLEEQFTEEFFSFDGLEFDDEPKLPTSSNNNSDNPSDTITESHSDTGSQSSNSGENSNPTETDKNTSPPTSTTPNKSTDKQEDSPDQAPKPTISVDIVEQTYTPKFKKLENAAIVRLDALFTTAYEEYKEGTLSKSELARKYIQAGEKLQSGVDGVFYNLLSELEKELKSNNLPTDLVKEAETSYKDAISSKKSEFFSKL